MNSITALPSRAWRQVNEGLWVARCNLRLRRANRTHLFLWGQGWVGDPVSYPPGVQRTPQYVSASWGVARVCTWEGTLEDASTALSPGRYEATLYPDDTYCDPVADGALLVRPSGSKFVLATKEHARYWGYGAKP